MEADDIYWQQMGGCWRAHAWNWQSQAGRNMVCGGNVERKSRTAHARGTQQSLLAYNYKSFVALFVRLLFCKLATSKVISRWVPTCDSAHAW